MKKKSIRAEEFDTIFDKGDEITEYLIVEEAERPGLKPRRVSIDFPAWMVKELDREAHRLGITRQSVIKYWISEKLHPSAE
ncbi:MAG: CopG family transcriptional regulator [Bacteroidota bacterium]|nr:CopG family transcriptional regulator [Bacteroidota bacterium]